MATKTPSKRKLTSEATPKTQASISSFFEKLTSPPPSSELFKDISTGCNTPFKLANSDSQRNKKLKINVESSRRRNCNSSTSKENAHSAKKNFLLEVKDAVEKADISAKELRSEAIVLRKPAITIENCTENAEATVKPQESSQIDCKPVIDLTTGCSSSLESSKKDTKLTGSEDCAVITRRLQLPAFKDADTEKKQHYQAQIEQLYNFGKNMLADSFEYAHMGQANSTTEQKLSYSVSYFKKNAPDEATSETTDFSEFSLNFMAHFIQASLSTLQQLSRFLLIILGSNGKKYSLLQIEMQVKKMAKRMNYGIKARNINIYEEESPIAMFVWEVGASENYFSSSMNKTIKDMRAQRRRRGSAIKTLQKIITMLQQADYDKTKLSLEEAKISKYEHDNEVQRQKMIAREKKEEMMRQKLIAREKKKEDLLQAKIAKNEEKAQRLRQKQQRQTEKHVADKSSSENTPDNKKRKSLLSYFMKCPQNCSGNEIIDLTSNSGDQSLSGKVGVEPRYSGTSNELDILFDYLSGSSKIDASLTGVLAKKPCRISWRHNGHRRRNGSFKNYNVRKLLQFHDNYRPAYYGSYCNRKEKKFAIRKFRFGRRPITKLKSLIDYSRDSDGEWEEEEPGESLSGSEDCDENMEDMDDLDYDDKWLAYENEVEYIDNDCGIGDNDSAEGEGKKMCVKRSKEAHSMKLKRVEPTIHGPFIVNSITAEPPNSAFYKYRVLVLDRIAPPMQEHRVEATPSIADYFIKNTLKKKSV